MSIIVGTNSYVNQTYLLQYAVDRGITIVEPNVAILLIKSMDWIEVQTYKYQKYESDQALQFPRSVTTYDVPLGTVPSEVLTTQCVAALLIDSGEDLNPIVERAVKREEVFQATKVEYMETADEVNRYPQLTQLLSRWLDGGSGSFEVRRA